MIRHHPDTALLLDHAVGSLPAPVSLVVATHACMCEECRAQLGGMEAVGGALLEELAPVGMSDDALAETLARLDVKPPRAEPARPVLDAETLSLVPPALRPYLGGNVRDLKWRWRGPALRAARLDTGTPGYYTSLFRLRPGAAAPAHGHAGNEYTLVLDGSFSEHGEVYGIGDFARADSTAGHVQVADSLAGCICLTVLDAPVRLLGLAALLNPFLRF